MKQIKHSLEFVTELDENNPTAKRLLAIDEIDQKNLLNLMLNDLLGPHLEPILKDINANNSYATLKLVK